MSAKGQKQAKVDSQKKDALVRAAKMEQSFLMGIDKNDTELLERLDSNFRLFAQDLHFGLAGKKSKRVYDV